MGVEQATGRPPNEKQLSPLTSVISACVHVPVSGVLHWEGAGPSQFMSWQAAGGVLVLG